MNYYSYTVYGYLIVGMELYYLCTFHYLLIVFIMNQWNKYIMAFNFLEFLLDHFYMLVTHIKLTHIKLCLKQFAMPVTLR